MEIKKSPFETKKPSKITVSFTKMFRELDKQRQAKVSWKIHNINRNLKSFDGMAESTFKNHLLDLYRREIISEIDRYMVNYQEDFLNHLKNYITMRIKNKKSCK